MVPLRRGIGDEEAWPPMAGGGSKSVEIVAQQMAINGQKVLLKPGSEEDETTSILDKKFVDNPKRVLRCETECREDTKDMLAL